MSDLTPKRLRELIAELSEWDAYDTGDFLPADLRDTAAALRRLLVLERTIGDVPHRWVWDDHHGDTLSDALAQASREEDER